MIIFQGLNPIGMKSERIELDIDSNLDAIYLTIESIYLVANSVPFYFDWEEKKLKKLSDLKILSSCSNTNYFWCLIKKDNSSYQIIQFSYNTIVENISINILEDKNLLILSTDINTYVFQNQTYGFKCLFELKTKQELEKKVSDMEKSLNENSISNIELNKILIPEKCIQFATGKEHILALTETGGVYSFGIGTKGQLGDGKIQNDFRFKKIAEAKKLCNGSPGWHSALIDENHRCFLWGWNSNSQLEHTDSESVFVPKPKMLDLKNEISDQPIDIDQVSLGAKHTILVDKDCNLYSFGWNKYNQLIFENDDQEFDVDCPVKITEFNNRVLQVKCGPWSTLLRLKN